MQFTTLSGSFKKTASDERYWYVVGTSGMVIVNKGNYEEVAYLSVSGGFSDVWTNEICSNVYMTSSGGGLYKLEKTAYSGNLQTLVYKYLETPAILTNDILTINGIDDNEVAIGTTSGVEYILGNNIYSSEQLRPVLAVTITDNSDLYYGGAFGLAKKSNINNDWLSPDQILHSGSLPPLVGIVTALDSIITDSGNLIAAGTSSSGVYILKEGNMLVNSSILNLILE